MVSGAEHLVQYKISQSLITHTYTQFYTVICDTIICVVCDMGGLEKWKPALNMNTPTGKLTMLFISASFVVWNIAVQHTAMNVGSEPGIFNSCDLYITPRYSVL